MADVSAHGFWKRGTTAMFDIIIVNLDAGSYLHMTPEKALAKAEKEAAVGFSSLLPLSSPVPRP